jgi:hypothetical protein
MDEDSAMETQENVIKSDIWRIPVSQEAIGRGLMSEDCPAKERERDQLEK